MSRRSVRYSDQETLYYMDGNFAILVPWVPDVLDCDRSPGSQKKKTKLSVTILDDGLKSHINVFQSNNDALGARLI